MRRSVAGCQLLNQWIRGVNQACNRESGELFWASLGFSFSILLFHASDVFGQEIRAFSSISSVRCAEVIGVRRGAESVIGNLLALVGRFAQGRRECERKSEVGLQGSDSLFS